MSKVGKIEEVNQVEIPQLLHQHLKEFESTADPHNPEDEIETVESVKNSIQATKLDTRNKKHDFINSIRNGLGDDIREVKGMGVKEVKKPKKGFKDFIKGIFSKF